MTKQVIIHTDGGSRGNPGPAGAGVEICDGRGRSCFRGGYFLGKTTNNVAEYTGLVRGLEAAKQLGASEVKVYLDSELLVRQMNGEYKVKSALLRPLFEEAQRLLAGFASSSIEHVYREQNGEADRLANDAMDMKADVGDAVGGAVAGSVMEDEDVEGELLAAADIRDKVRFDKGKAVRVKLSEGDGLLAGLLCLEAGQEYKAKLDCEQATVTVMRGKGRVDFIGDRQKLEVGTWLHYAAVGELEFAADAGEQLVVILSVVK